VLASDRIVLGDAAFVVMMQTAHFTKLHYSTLCWRLYSSRLRCVFAERQVSSPPMVIAQYAVVSMQRAFAEYDDMIRHSRRSTQPGSQVLPKWSRFSARIGKRLAPIRGWLCWLGARIGAASSSSPWWRDGTGARTARLFFAIAARYRRGRTGLCTRLRSHVALVASGRGWRFQNSSSLGESVSSTTP
jgi:hypothetical protein